MLPGGQEGFQGIVCVQEVQGSAPHPLLQGQDYCNLKWFMLGLFRLPIIINSRTVTSGNCLFVPNSRLIL
jgi:hypothetical protein